MGLHNERHLTLSDHLTQLRRARHGGVVRLVRGHRALRDARARDGCDAAQHGGQMQKRAAARKIAELSRLLIFGCEFPEFAT